MASQVRATTLGGYRHNVRADPVPRLGDIPLQRLTTARAGAFYGELMASDGKGGRPLSPRRAAPNAAPGRCRSVPPAAGTKGRGQGSHGGQAVGETGQAGLHGRAPLSSARGRGVS
jgi:hypothetical protein